MVELQVKDLNAFNLTSEGPMVSLYMSKDMSLLDHKALNERWKEQLLKAEYYLLKDYNRTFVDDFMKKLWQENLLTKLDSLDQGIAIFYARDFLNREVGYVRMQTPVVNLVVVADSFHIRPLIKIENNNRDFFVVTASSRAINVLIENNRHLIRLDSYRNEPRVTTGNAKVKKDSKEFFLNSANELNKLFAAYRLPVVLAGVKDHIGHLRKLLNKSLIMDEAVVGNVEKMKELELRDRVYEILDPYYERQNLKATDELEIAMSKDRVVTSLQDIAQSAVHGKIVKLFVVENKHVWGLIDKKTAEMSITPTKINAHDDDVLDDLCQMVLSKKGEVVAVKDISHLRGASAAAIVSDRSHLFKNVKNGFPLEYLAKMQA